MLTSHQLFEAAVSSENKGHGLWFLDSDHSTAGTHLSEWHASDLTATEKKNCAINVNERTNTRV